jgi:hypothetical protein
MSGTVAADELVHIESPWRGNGVVLGAVHARTTAKLVVNTILN